MRFWTARYVIAFLGCIGLATIASSRAETGDEEGRIDFVRDVRPILQKHCYECHSGDVRKSGFRVDVRSEAFGGGESYGAAIQPHHPDSSPLWQFTALESADLKMPPEGNLQAAEVEILKQWIAQGADWPEGVDLIQLEDPRSHWAFQKTEQKAAPKNRDSSWPANAIDQFILSRLERENLRPAPAADRREWLRRVYYDLHGLPPSLEALEAFENDPSVDAYDKVVTQLLGSPRYGERWAQHWLDVVRYADTHGFEVNTERPNAWPYRDYVINAFNRDTPYDRFVREQIAGDTLGVDAATGFLVTASVLLPAQIGQDEPSKRLARQDALDEIVTNIGTSFLGLTIHCARCHHHKFDPISQRQYYEMQSFVAGVEYLDREFQTPLEPDQVRELEEWHREHRKIVNGKLEIAPLSSSSTRLSMVNSYENIDRFEPVTATKVRFRILSTNLYEPCIDELEVYNTEGVNVALATEGAILTASGSNNVPNRHNLQFANDGVYGNSSSWMSDQAGGGWLQVEFKEPQTIQAVVWGRDRTGQFSDRLAVQYAIDATDASLNWQTVSRSEMRLAFDSSMNRRYPIDRDRLSDEQKQAWDQLLSRETLLQDRIRNRSGKQTVFAGLFREPDMIRVLARGNPETPKDLVTPAVLTALGEYSLEPLRGESGRRAALANWLVHESNPLTSRVIANRIWQGHFGVGLVETSNDFGKNGVAPSHPELLDWLAVELVRNNWSLKSLHRLIVLSSTYRQSSRFNPDADRVDGECRWLWRFPPRRLMGEEIRDSMLQINGNLDLKMGGSGFSLFEQRGGLSGFTPIEVFSGQGLRRMIYSHRVRRERDAVFGAFDCPDFGQSSARRIESTVSLQALNLFNSRFTLDQASVLSDRIQKVADREEDRIRRVYQAILLRSPSADELIDASMLVRSHGLNSLCRALFNSNEFLFLR